MKVIALLCIFQMTQESVQSRMFRLSYEFFFKIAADSKTTAAVADVVPAETAAFGLILEGLQD